MADREKVIKEFECAVRKANGEGWDFVDLLTEDGFAILDMLKEQEDSIRILTGDLEDLQKEHERLLDKKIPLITNGQEVTYCKDCAHWIPGVITDNDDFIPPRCRRNSGGWSADEFCSNAEKRRSGNGKRVYR